jgi:hypothetical protein
MRLVPELTSPSRWLPEPLSPVHRATFRVRPAAFRPGVADPELRVVEPACLVAELARPVALAQDSSAHPQLAEHPVAAGVVARAVVAAVERT